MQTETEGREAGELRPQEAARYLGMGITYVYAVLRRTRGPHKQQDQEHATVTPATTLNKPAKTVIVAQLFPDPKFSRRGRLGGRGGVQPTTFGLLPARPRGLG